MWSLLYSLVVLLEASPVLQGFITRLSAWYPTILNACINFLLGERIFAHGGELCICAKVPGQTKSLEVGGIALIWPVCGEFQILIGPCVVFIVRDQLGHSMLERHHDRNVGSPPSKFLIPFLHYFSAVCVSLEIFLNSCSCSEYLAEASAKISFVRASS